MKRNIKLTIEYDGTEFVGWQCQSNGRSVQEVIEQTLAGIIQESISIVGAGRTDSGVHARGQVASGFVDTTLTNQDLYRALNGTLPADIVIHTVEDVDEKFSARYSAKQREYRYYIRRQPSAIQRRYCWQLGYHLDVQSMNRIAESILGVGDFQAMSKTDSTVEHYRCQIFESQWMEHQEELVYTVRANRFLQGMVRALVGTMVNVGRGYTPEAEFKNILESKNRSNAGQSAPAQGLFLERVTY